MMNQKDAACLVDDRYLLHLRETDEGFRYCCLDTLDGDIESNLISWGEMLESPIHDPLACARVLAIQDIGLDGEKVAAVSPEMLSQFPRGRWLLRELGKNESSMEHSIRFIDSRYNEKFRIPDGGVIQITYPDKRQFSQRCSYIDDYHMQAGYSIYHICQFAEMLERGGGSCRPEPIVQAECATWRIHGKGCISIRSCGNSYDYVLHDCMNNVIDAQLNVAGIFMNEVRDKVLLNIGWEHCTIERVI